MRRFLGQKTFGKTTKVYKASENTKSKSKNKKPEKLLLLPHNQHEMKKYKNNNRPVLKVNELFNQDPGRRTNILYTFSLN